MEEDEGLIDNLENNLGDLIVILFGTVLTFIPLIGFPLLTILVVYLILRRRSRRKK